MTHSGRMIFQNDDELKTGLGAWFEYWLFSNSLLCLRKVQTSGRPEHLARWYRHGTERGFWHSTPVERPGMAL